MNPRTTLLGRTALLRWARAVALFALFGLTTSVAVAWGIALWPVDPYSYTYQLEVNISPEGQPSWSSIIGARNSYRWGFQHAELSQAQPSDPLNALVLGRVRSQLDGGFTLPFAPRDEWAFPLRQPNWPPWLPSEPKETTPYKTWSARAAGWPWLCMSSRARVHADTGIRAPSGALRLVGLSPVTPAASDPDIGTIPLIPYWPRLMANTGFYGFLWAALLIAPARLRSIIRRRRGLCSACGYDRRGGLTTGCPECGLGRTPVPTSP